MRRIIQAFLSLILLAGFASTASAEVKRVEMRLAGYLCGN